jgi:hypothetical protein
MGLPAYSVETLAANYPNRVDHSILSGPYVPVYLAQAEIDRRDEIIAHLKARLARLNDSLEAMEERLDASQAAYEAMKRERDIARAAVDGAFL